MHSYPRISESVSVFDLKYGKKYYPNSIPCEFDPFPSLHPGAGGPGQDKGGALLQGGFGRQGTEQAGRQAGAPQAAGGSKLRVSRKLKGGKLAW